MFEEYENEDHDVMDEEIFDYLKTPEERLRKQQEEDLDPFPERSLGLVPPDENVREFTEEDAQMQQMTRISPGRLYSDYTILPRSKMKR